MPTSKIDIYVYAHWLGMPSPAIMGILSSHQGKGRRSYSFEYTKEWLSNWNVMLLDPDIGFYSGPQFPAKKENFGIFFDSMPDTWGRMLMKRRAAQIARIQGNKAAVLNDTDFLLGVADYCRMGGLRFKLHPDGDFLSSEKLNSVPPWTSVGELQHIAGLVESERETKELDKWLIMLMAPGSSLGGARPKANVSDRKGDLWIAKFPSKNDTIDKAKWEFLAYKLAIAAGIWMAECKIEKVSGDYHTFYTKRFDRRGGERIHFASAMTMTGNNEDTIRNSPASYLDLALFIQNHGGNIDGDLAQLWRRVIFNIAISNTDDHLRNHGFVIENKVWRLSPAYDLNPSIDKDNLSLNIDDNSAELDFDLAMEVIEYFRLSQKEAGAIMSEVRNVVSQWQKSAKNIGISRHEAELMSLAFRY